MSSRGSTAGPLVLRRLVTRFERVGAVQFVGSEVDSPLFEHGEQGFGGDRVLRPRGTQDNLTERLVWIASSRLKALIGFILEGNGFCAHPCTMHIAQVWCQFVLQYARARRSFPMN